MFNAIGSYLEPGKYYIRKMRPNVRTHSFPYPITFPLSLMLFGLRLSYVRKSLAIHETNVRRSLDR